MARQLQLRRGTTSEHSTFTGAPGEVTVDTVKNVPVVHDGVTAGGFAAARESVVNTKVEKNADIVAGTATKVTYDSKGLVTSGSNPTTLNGYGITDAYTKTEVDNKDATLQTNIDTEKGRVDAILSASSADKDSFKEIVDLINSVDTTNDTAFAGYVLSNDAAVALKAPIVNPTFTGTVSGVTKGMVGLGNVDNTSDANKPISTAVQSALALKADDNVTVHKTSDVGVAYFPAGTTAQRPILGSNVQGIRYNTDLLGWESWNGSFWGSLGSGQMLGNAPTKAISYNAQSVTENITVPAGVNAYSVGNVTIEAGASITISAGSSYKLI